MTQQIDQNIRVVAITGSVRPGNYTSKALALVVDEIEKRQNVILDLINPGELNLPFPGMDGDSSGATHIQELVSKANGVILATPEYHGGYSSVIKLVIENLGFPSTLAGKPLALLGVAAGQIGAIKSLENLASVCLHVWSILLPGMVSVAGVQQVIDDEGRCLDENVERRIRSVATNLLDYIEKDICPRVSLEAAVRS